MRNGPQIITNGLVLALDAADNLSYSGSGSSWRDISGNNTVVTLSNNPTFSNLNSGIINLDGVDDHVVISREIGSTFSQLTVEIIFKTPDAGNSGNAYLIWDHSAGYPIWLGKSQGNEWYWFWNFNSGAAKAARLSSTSYVANTWIHIVARAHMSNSTTLTETGNFAEIVVNGGMYSTLHRNDNATALNYGSTSIYLGRRGTSVGNGELGGTVANYANISIGLFRIYNRVLSRSEIQQNFNAVRGRFGI